MLEAWSTRCSGELSQALGMNASRHPRNMAWPMFRQALPMRSQQDIDPDRPCRLCQPCIEQPCDSNGFACESVLSPL
jgi:hypothetical protein